MIDKSYENENVEKAQPTQFVDELHVSEVLKSEPPPVKVRPVGQYSQRFSNEVLNQRLCVSLATSFDFLASGMSHILHRHLRMYNDPPRFTAIRDHWPRYHEFIHQDWSMGPFDFHFNVPSKPQLGKIAVEKSSTGRDLLVLKTPIKFFTNVHTNKEPIGFEIG